ncbi:ionotropic receptor 75a-like [Hylaeus volcanicus]|uniref:ionotropic receptor 75a-like n=1 Tax=Hylaeus volcanicus TaxID=313075 RepID=UPI0023B81690|nr:ionotropic receptor 75a-like [Hylaeus volcanicus]
MHLRNFISLQLIVISYASSVDFIRDYFVYKDVTRVAGLSCREYDNNYQIIRLLNDVGISVSIHQLGSNVNISRFLHTEYWGLGVFLDLRCSTDEESVTIFNEVKLNRENYIVLIYFTSAISKHFNASASNMFEKLHRWLVLGTNTSLDERALNDSTFSVVTDFVISIPRNDDDYVLYDLYNHCKHCGGSLNITEFGSWTKNSGLTVALREGKIARRWNFHKMKVKTAGIVECRPKDLDLIEYLEKRNTALDDHWSKFGFAIIKQMASMFNITLDLIELSHWEKHDRNGPVFAGFRDRHFDLSYYPSILTNERLNFADVMVQLWPSRTCFLFLAVPSTTLDMQIIFRPFEKTVWYMIAFLSVIIIFILWIILKLDKDSDYEATVLIIVAALSQQGLPFNSSHIASRVAFLQTLIFGLLVYNCYSAAIVSSRLRHVPWDKMNDSLYSLANSNLKLSANKDIYFNILINSPPPDVQYFKKHWDTLPENSRFQPLHEGIRGIMNPKFAYHANPMNAYPVIEIMMTKMMICQLTEVHLLRPSMLGFWSSHHSPLHEIAKIGFIRTLTSGIRKREVYRWTSRKPYCDEHKRYVSSVTILEATPVILLLLTGIILSVVICVIENIVFRAFQTKPDTIKKLECSNKLHQKKVASITAPGDKTNGSKNICTKRKDVIVR